MERSMKWPLLLFCIGVFMAALDNGIITASLTTLISSFGVSATWGSWTITLYTLGLAISVPIVGKLSDQFGRKKLFLIEVIIFGLGSLLVVLSTNFPLFLAARFVQSMGGGGIFIIASSYVLNSFPHEKQGRALGLLGAMNGIAAILGPNIGALILGLTGDWHWLFLINVPIAVILVVLGSKYIQQAQDFKKERMDWLGLSFLTLGIVFSMYSLTVLNGVNLVQSLKSPEFIGFAGAGMVMFILLYFIEKKVKAEPVLPLGLLRNASYRWTLIIAMFSGAILATVIFIPAFIEQYLNVSPSVAGYWFTPLALASGIGAGMGGVLVDKKGPIPTLLLASILSLIGFVLFPFWVESLGQMAVASCFVGLGFSMMLGAPVNMLATEKAGDRKGIALGTTSLFRQIGMVLAPTLYAGFLARNFRTIGTNIQTNLQEAHIQAPTEMLNRATQLNTGDFQTVKQAFEQIPSPQVKQVLLDTLHEVVGKGYGSLFIAAMIISLLTLICVLILTFVRQKSKPMMVVGKGR